MNFLIKQVVARSRPYNHLPQDHGFSYQVVTQMQVH